MLRVGVVFGAISRGLSSTFRSCAFRATFHFCVRVCVFVVLCVRLILLRDFWCLIVFDSSVCLFVRVVFDFACFCIC